MKDKARVRRRMNQVKERRVRNKVKNERKRQENRLKNLTENKGYNVTRTEEKY